MKNFYKIITTILVISMLTMVGCSTKEVTDKNVDETANDTNMQSSEQAKEATAYVRPLDKDYSTEKKVEIKHLIYGASAAVTDIKTEDYYSFISEHFNVDYKPMEVSKNTFTDKLNTMWLSNDIPDIVTIIEDPQKVKQGIENGIFADFTDDVMRHPELSEYNYDLLRTDNKLYTPILQRPAAMSIAFRKDWQEKLGLPDPKTPEDLLNMAKAFTNDDPDGNGLNDTYGITIIGQGLKFTDPYWQMFVPAFSFSSGTYYIDEADNQIKDSIYLVDEMKAGLKWWNEAYESGALDKEFITDEKKTSEAKFVTGKAGMWNKAFIFLAGRESKLKLNYPDGHISVMPAINSSYGSNYRVPIASVYDHFEGVSTVSEDADVIQRAKDILTFSATLEGYERRLVGVEGKHYRIENNTMVYTPEDQQQNFNAGHALMNIGKLPVQFPDLEEWFQTKDQQVVIKNVNPYMVESEAYMKRSGDLNKLMIETFTRMIIGDLDIDEYDNFLAQYKEIGGDQILTEANATYSHMK